jgi:hypothetical protein
MITPKKAPYSTTESDPDKTMIEIEKLLRAYGIESFRWTKEYAKNRVALEFLVEVETKGVKKEIAILIEPPPIAQERRTWDVRQGRYVKVLAPNWAQSLRLTYWWIKSKLEAVAYGLATVEKEFLSQVMVSLPEGGGSKTVGELIGVKVVEGTFLPQKTEPYNVTGQSNVGRPMTAQEAEFKEVSG